MKQLSILLLFFLILSCRKDEEIVPLRPAFATKCLIKRIISVSPDNPNSDSRRGETVYDYDESWKLKKVTGIDEWFSKRVKTHGSKTETICRYDAADFLVEQIYEYSSTALHQNAPVKIRLVYRYEYQNGQLVKEIVKIEEFNFHAEKGKDYANTYKYVGNELVSYRQGEGDAFTEYFIKNGILYDYKRNEGAGSETIFELNKYGFVTKQIFKYTNIPNSTSIYTHEYDDLGRVVKTDYGDGGRLFSTELFTYTNNPKPESLGPKLKGHPVVPNLWGNGSFYNLRSSESIRYDYLTGKEEYRGYTKNYQQIFDANGLLIEQKPIGSNQDSQTYEYVNCN